MAKKTKRKSKFKIILEQNEQAWDWIRKTTRYKKDYKLQQSKINNRELFPREVSIDEFINYEKLREKPFGASSDDFPTLEQIAYQECIKEKWGFYPLVDPNMKKVPVGLRDFIKNLVNPPYRKAVQPTNITMLELLLHDKTFIPLPPLPDRLSIDINYQKRDREIIKELKHLLEIFRKEYVIKDRRPRISSLVDQYKMCIMRHYATEKQIKKALYSNLAKSNPNLFETSEDCKRKRLKRLKAKLFQKRPNKF